MPCCWIRPATGGVVLSNRAVQGACGSNQKDKVWVNLPCSPQVKQQVYAAFFLTAVVPDLRILHAPSAALWNEPAI